jgi:hypothetical protein
MYVNLPVIVIVLIESEWEPTRAECPSQNFWNQWNQL